MPRLDHGRCSPRAWRPPARPRRIGCRMAWGRARQSDEPANRSGDSDSYEALTSKRSGAVRATHEPARQPRRVPLAGAQSSRNPRTALTRALPRLASTLPATSCTIARNIEASDWACHSERSGRRPRSRGIGYAGRRISPSSGRTAIPRLRPVGPPLGMTRCGTRMGSRRAPRGTTARSATGSETPPHTPPRPRCPRLP